MRIGKSHVSIAEAAEYLGVSGSRVYELIAEKRLRSVWDYGHRWVPRADLDKYAAERKGYLEGASSKVAGAPCSQGER
ncbi:hypothetical protein ES705_39442 [subsurface metagenome]